MGASAGASELKGGEAVEAGLHQQDVQQAR